MEIMTKVMKWEVYEKNDRLNQYSVSVDLVLTSDELVALYEGKVVTGESPTLHVQIVGYGEGEGKIDLK